MLDPNSSPSPSLLSSHQIPAPTLNTSAFTRTRLDAIDDTAWESTFAFTTSISHQPYCLIAFVPHRSRQTRGNLHTQLSATDYGNFLANEPLPISTATIAEKATQILVDQFKYLRNNAVEPLSKFLDYVTYGYMIDKLTLTSKRTPLVVNLLSFL
ncbi:hypothetical protein BT96DRAFT_1023344 [Gymnopus androsaceus JB14]|uniref:Uncharacterized protein n=1 Tax=Gymnopus androsaceus JB14 TaxID=1447944 RepID=A0A6A4H3L3_9AGAR|nr:hypothetical protein BT96DRAFT_1023344 [Gymnopus androsaceus JB14]